MKQNFYSIHIHLNNRFTYGFPKHFQFVDIDLDMYKSIKDFLITKGIRKSKFKHFGLEIDEIYIQEILKYLKLEDWYDISTLAVCIDHGGVKNYLSLSEYPTIDDKCYAIKIFNKKNKFMYPFVDLLWCKNILKYSGELPQKGDQIKLTKSQYKELTNHYHNFVKYEYFIEEINPYDYLIKSDENGYVSLDV